MRACLKPAEFERYERGQASESDAAEIRQHLEHCDACRIAHEEHKKDTAFLEDVGSLTLAELQDDGSSRGLKTPVRRRAADVYPTIEGYTITGVVGQGGMGIVYRAVQARLNRTVALKVLPAMVGTASPSAVARFRREATAAARLHHTNIVPIYDFGESPDAYFYAMELIIGQPLHAVTKRLRDRNVATASPIQFAQLLRESIADPSTSEGSENDEPTRLDESAEDHRTTSIGATIAGRRRVYFQQVARWMADAADALHYAHGQGIIHRDVKPANLIISIDGRIMLADFGLAKGTDEESITITGSLLGTLRYISPEQAMAKRVRVDHRTDVYSLGATMYELLCFQPAFPGQDSQEILGAIISRDPSPPRKVSHAVPPELETICLKAMEKSPDARYPTARAMSEDLCRFIQDLPIVAKKPGPIKRTIKFVRRRKALVFALAAGALLAIAAPVLMKERTRRHTAEVDRSRAQQRQAQEEEQRKIAERGREVEELEKLTQTVRTNVLSEEWMKAERNLQTLRERWPIDRSVHVLSAWKLIEQTRKAGRSNTPLLQEALAYCNKALKIERDEFSALNYKGIILKRLGRYDEAIEVAERAVDILAERYSAWGNLGAYYAIKGDIERAEQALRKSAQLAQKVTEGARHHRAMAWSNLAALELHLERASAEDSVIKAIAHDEHNRDARLLMARVWLATRDEVFWAKAVNVATLADTFRETARSKRILAIALMRTGDWTGALETARSAIALGDLPSPNELVSSIAQSKLGDGEQAEAALRRATNAWPEDLVSDGAFRASYDNGVLWFDSAAELNRLRFEAEQAIQALQTRTP